MVVDIPNEQLKTFKWHSRGNIKMQFDWSTNVISFDSGKKQYQQKLTIPFRTISGTFSGLVSTYTELQNFFLYHKQQIPFFVYYLSNRYKVRFANATLEPTLNQEITDTGTEQIGFSVDIAFAVETDRWDWNSIKLTDSTFIYDFDPMPNIPYPATIPGFNDAMTQYIDAFGNIWRLNAAKLSPTHAREFSVGLNATSNNFCVQLEPTIYAKAQSISAEFICRFESTVCEFSLGNLGKMTGVAGNGDIPIYNDRYEKTYGTVGLVFGNEYALQFNPMYVILVASFKTKKISVYVGGGSHFGFTGAQSYSSASCAQNMFCNGLHVSDWGIGNFLYKVRVKTPAIDAENIVSPPSDLSIDSNTVAFFDAT